MHTFQGMVAHFTVQSESTFFDIMDINAILITLKPLTHKRIPMAEQLDPKELVRFQELLMVNSIIVDSLTQLLMEKGIITDEEFFAKMKEVQMEYKEK